MPSRHERRAAALEAIAHALLELAAVEREPPEESNPKEVLVDRRNCEKELGLKPGAFTAAAGRYFPAFRVSKRLTASKADVLAWLKSRTVEPKAVRAPPPSPTPTAAEQRAVDRDSFLGQVDACFAKRVGRRMTDQELDQADICVDVAHSFEKMTGKVFNETPDEVARRVQEKIGKEPVYVADWRSLGLDPAKMMSDAEELRVGLHAEHPDWTWRQRQEAVHEMWGAISGPLSEARRTARAEARAKKKAEKVRQGELGLKK